MRTAMQELIEQLEFIKLNKTKNLHEVIFFDGVLAIIDAGKYLEQEKEQMIDFSMQMHKIDCSKTGTDLLLDEAQAYYNQKYNQNK